MQPGYSELEAKQRELLELRQRANELESTILDAAAGQPWTLTGFYTAYYAMTGFMLGLIAATVSLLFNIIGAAIAGKDSLELIRVYLTFPLGEKALSLSNQADKVYAINNGVILAAGCCLYLVTGMLLGVPFHVTAMRIAATAKLPARLLFGAVLGLLLWVFNFYGILSWLQPMTCGGNWITNPEYLPWWVAASTHVVFGVTMVLVSPLGQYVPYHSPAEDLAPPTT